MARRQNRSCDQCRRAKRACDAPVLSDLGHGSDGGDGQPPYADLCLPPIPSFESLLANQLLGESRSVDPCSYCLKTQRECTLNWVRSQTSFTDSARRPKRRRTGPGTTLETPSSVAAGSHTSDLGINIDPLPVPPTDANVVTENTAASVVSGPGVAPLVFPSSSIPTTSVGVTSFFDDDNAFLLDADLTLPGLPHLHALTAAPAPDAHRLATTMAATIPTATVSAGSPFRRPPPRATELSTFDNPHALYSIGNFPKQDQCQAESHQTGQSYTSDHDLNYSHERSTTYPSSQSHGHNRYFHGSRSNSTLSSSVRHPSDIFPMAPISPDASMPVSCFFDHTLMTKTNNSLICDSLMRVYHDVIENALSCWLTEETCPYKMLPRSLSLSTVSVIGSESMQREWSPAWSNRIYRRVIQLDRIARSTNIICLSRDEDINASRALHLAIMAFATQWAQGSRRSREGFIAPWDSGVDGVAELEFDRTIQWSLWNQARSALQDCANVESFRVTCAELIFGLTQKPLEDFEQDAFLPSTASAQYKTARHCVGILLSKEGPPMFHERACRKLHAMKARFEMYESGFNLLQRGSRCHIPSQQQQQQQPEEQKLTGEDRRTIGLLYWLALMFDTVSSAMNERPLAVSDSECQEELLVSRMRAARKTSEAVSTSVPTSLSGDIDKAASVLSSGPAQYSSRSSSVSMVDNGRYWSELFVKYNSSTQPPTQSLRWPCVYEDAARFLTKAAPVKVLLFRHVTYLQRLVTRSSSSSSFPTLGDPDAATEGELVERHIQEALAVYRHWSVTYAPFFRDLIDKYDTVPPRIQSWFVCLLGHWHLAGLMLADLIEFIDDQELGITEVGRNRQVANLITRLRKSNAHGLADIGRVSSPSASAENVAQYMSPEPTHSLSQSQSRPEQRQEQHQPSPGQLDYYHSAINEGSILTEPWTMILIRAFSKAAIILLEEAEGFPRDGDDGLGHMDGAYLELIEGCDNCIRALRCLGKKSDMAGSVAVVLTQARSGLITVQS